MGAARVWLVLATASAPCLAGEAGPLSLSLTRPLLENGGTPGDAAGRAPAPGAGPMTPSLSITPRPITQRAPTAGDGAPAGEREDAPEAPHLLTDRSLEFGGDDAAALEWARASERSPFDLAPRLRIEVSRPTHLRDGGVSGSDGALGDDRLAAFADDRGDIDMYNVAFRWDALRPGPVTFSLIGGVQAIQADIVGRVGEYDTAGRLVSTRLDDAYGIAAVPVFGGGVRWDVSDAFYISGVAQTHTIPDGASLLDLTAQTGLDLSPTVGLRAGYQYLRTSVRVQDLDASLSVSGVFARLEIAF